MEKGKAATGAERLHFLEQAMNIQPIAKEFLDTAETTLVLFGDSQTSGAKLESVASDKRATRIHT